MSLCSITLGASRSIDSGSINSKRCKHLEVAKVLCAVEGVAKDLPNMFKVHERAMESYISKSSVLCSGKVQ